MRVLLLVAACLAVCPVDINKTSYNRFEQNAFFRYSHVQCLTFPPCVDAFFLQSEFYDYMHFKAQLEIFMYQSGINISSACIADPIWPRVMAMFRPCQPNEIRDPDDGCICRPDKRCDENEPEDLQISSVVKVIVAAGLGAMFIYFGTTSLSRQRNK
jgi:hypothetical protein